MDKNDPKNEDKQPRSDSPDSANGATEEAALPVKETEVVPIEPTPAPDPVETESTPEQAVDTPPTPVIVPEEPAPKPPEPPAGDAPAVKSEPEPSPKPEPAPVPKPELKHEPKLVPPTGQTFDINQLSDEQLKAAAALYIKKNQRAISAKGVAKRRETMQLNLREIVDFLSHHNGSPLPRIAHRTNITSGTTSKYLRQLIASGKVRAEGWGKTRRYYLK